MTSTLITEKKTAKLQLDASVITVVAIWKRLITRKFIAKRTFFSISSAPETLNARPRLMNIRAAHLICPRQRRGMAGGELDERTFSRSVHLSGRRMELP